MNKNICSTCNGLGYLSYNPDLNPNLFEGVATCKCTKCNGTGTMKETAGEVEEMLAQEWRTDEDDFDDISDPSLSQF